MKVAFGLKAHSGWAAFVAIGRLRDEYQVVDRFRMELVETDDASWAKQPYHAAEDLEIREARALVKRGIVSAGRIAQREMQKAVTRVRDEGHNVVRCAVLSSDPMPSWTVDEILAVHFRMHKAEGVLFREVLASAAETCGLDVLRIPEKELSEYARRSLALSIDGLRATVVTLGKSVGPPWGKDQKDATIAAMIALQGRMK